MPIDLDQLEALAIAAKQIAAGPWCAGTGSDPGFIGLWRGREAGAGGLLGVIGSLHDPVDEQVALARFIASVDPDVVLALVRELRAARRNK